MITDRAPFLIWQEEEPMSKIDMEMFIKNAENYQAHIKTDENNGEVSRELLQEHIERTVKYFENLWNQKYIDDFLENYQKQRWGSFSDEGKILWKELIKGIPLFHDMGKINPAFQSKIVKNNKALAIKELSACEGTRHSLISAILYLDYYFKRIKEEKIPKAEKDFLREKVILHSYVIARHHSDLHNFGKYIDILLCNAGCDLMQIFENRGTDICQWTFTLKANRIKNIWDTMGRTISSLSGEKCIADYIYIKVLYSLLVAADYYATAEFMSGTEVVRFNDLREIEKWKEVYENTDLLKSIRKYQKEKYPCSNQELKEEKNINVLRTEMFCDAEKVLNENKKEALFYLEAPTGSGKSNTAVNLGFQLLESDSRLQKLYYIYPFNTLVEQNLQSLYGIFGNGTELSEQIAVINSLTPIKMVDKRKQKEEETESTMYYQRALLDRQFLNYPVVISTHVSLFDIMFGDSKESAFAFHQLLNSVIVLDEIQSYQNIIWSEIAYFLKEFAGLMNIKIIIMSATLPDLDYLTSDIYPAVKLMKNREKYFENFCFKNRVNIHYDLLDKPDIESVLIKCIQEKFLEKKKVLVEFIKKDSAYKFFKKLKSHEEIAADIEYMSGDDSIAERSRILKKVKNASQGMILIATQVIEAGVDIDMDVGYKNISKLDSEEQFLGRINRSCLRSGEVWFFQLDKAKNIYGGDIRAQEDLTLDNKELRNLLLEKDFASYYEKVMKILKDNWNENTGEIGLDQFFHDEVGRLKFKEVKERMKLIEEDRWSMSVYLSRILEDENGEIIDGDQLWNDYAALLNDFSISYAEKRIKLSEITSKMNYFIYQIKKNPDLVYDDKIGEIFCIKEADKYFKDGKLERGKLQEEVGDFVDFI